MSVLHNVTQRFHAMEISPKIEAALKQCPEYQTAHIAPEKTVKIANLIVILSLKNGHIHHVDNTPIERALLINCAYESFSALIHQYFENNHLSQCEYLLIAFARRLAQHEADNSQSPEMQHYSQLVLTLAKQWDKVIKKQRQQWLKMVS
ncbi:hypothetical protein ACFOD0_14705 [Shewanella intestini]|uniref:Uncharacterized protein n=1 Tax=Shewanella intestini TaxID=2017544 RepID=A0ABS5I6S6_9GAMM|nr:MULTISPECIES: hypothetical protein [Shewanella]MBR9729543.1 hypothetical protein [Shewanella intestini]MRG37516.1 hypothetical protein [Shewanella sp. XMDDZSB0408]